MTTSPTNMVLYHENCPDGFGAAFAAWLKFGDNAQYVPAAYGKAAPCVKDKDVYILDFSFDADVLDVMSQEARSITLLDHHVTAQKKLRGYQCRCGKISFDLNRSGAMMAWNHFHPDTPAPALIEHIQDRDLWKWKLPNSESFLTALDSVGMDFQKWKAVLEHSEQEAQVFLAKGAAMREQTKSVCEDIADKAAPVRLQGQETLIVNASPMFKSEVGSLLAKQTGTFAIVWNVAGTTAVKVSLRSVPGFDVEAMAAKYGGGGHPQAAAFVLPIDKLPALLRGEL